MAAARERQRQVGDAGDAGADGVGAVGGDRDRRAATGQDEVEDREVVRREVPEHVDVRLHEAQVDAHRVDVLEVAERRRPRSASRICWTAAV